MENILVSYEVVGEYTGSVLDKGEGVLINTLLGSDNKPVYIVLTKDGRFRALASNQLKALNVDDKFDRCACENFDKEIDEVLRGYDCTLVDLSKFCNEIQEFSDMLEDKPKPYWDGWYEAMEWVRTHGNPFEKQGEQKSSWSEEDCAYTTLIGEILDYEHRRGRFTTTDIKFFNNDIITVEQIQDWLKSLREKMKVE